MKRGNQFYIGFEIEDENGNLLTPSGVKKIQFNFESLENPKIYDGISEIVTYSPEYNSFLVYLSQEETFMFGSQERVDVRILFENDLIMGSYLKTLDIASSVKEVELV